MHERDTRRRFLSQLGLGGLAIAAVPAAGSLLAAAQAQEAQEDGEPDDADLAAVAETLELAAVEIYDRLASTGNVTTPAAVVALTDFARHHSVHAREFAAVAGSKATGDPNRRLVAIYADQIDQTDSENELLRLAFDLETAAASTYVAMLGDAAERDLVDAIAAIAPVASQHATTLGRQAGLAADRLLPAFEDLDLALDVTQYPATTTTSTTTTSPPEG